MPKKSLKNIAFGVWVLNSRLKIHKKQSECAQFCNVKQPYWSRIESQGLIPEDAMLVKICEVLQKSLSEAKSVIDSIQISSPYGYIAAGHERFKSILIEMSEQVPVQVCIIKDQPGFDSNAHERYYDWLSLSENLYFNFLIRRDGPIDVTLPSFHEFITSVADRWSSEDRDFDTLRSQLKCYVRQSDHRENGEAIPLCNTMILIAPKGFIPLSFIEVLNEEVYLDLIQNEVPQHEALARSVMLIKCGTEYLGRADHLADNLNKWIWCLDGVSERLWKPIDWSKLVTREL